MNARRRQSGLTLVELMVAMVISLLLLAGLVTIFASMRTSFSTTKELNQLVNQQRLAAAVASDSLSNAGYYPLTNRTVVGLYRTPEAAFPVSTTSVGINGSSVTLDFATDGQVVYGTGATSTGSADLIAVRMMTYPGASPLNCQGGANTTSPATIDHVISVIWVKPTVNQLECTVVTDDGTTQTSSTTPLVGGQLLPVPGTVYGGVESLIAVYGVDTTGSGSVDRYMSAQTLNSASGDVCPDPTSGIGSSSPCWPYVRSIRLELGFKSALDTKRTLSLMRTVSLQNAIGRNVNATAD